MPFVLSRKETFKYTVKVRQPRESGKLEEFEFTAEFRRVDQKRIDQLTTEMLVPDMRKEVLDNLWQGWSGIQALVKEGDVEVHKDMPVTEENKALLRVEPGLEEAVVQAWLDAVYVGPRKN